MSRSVARWPLPALTTALLVGCNAFTGISDLEVNDGTVDAGSSVVHAPSDGVAPVDGVPPATDAPPPDAGGAPPDAAADSPTGPKRVFVTSARYEGNLGGLAGADAKCNQLAQAADLPGTFVAWLSTKTVNAIDRLTGPGPWARVGEEVIAVTRAQLTAPPISLPIRKTETGDEIADLVWTATDIDGTFLDDDCSGWTTSNGRAHAAAGDAVRIEEPWTAATPRACSLELRLYCFEQ